MSGDDTGPWVDEGLVAALARAQGKFPPIRKSHENPHFKSQFADIADVLAAVRPILAEQGIAVIQPVEVNEMGTVLVTKLMLGEETIESRFVLPIENLDAQRVGSWLTYMRRYQLCALVGVHPEGDDDDGNAAQSAPQARSEAPKPPTVMLPVDWRERPLAAMSFPELRAVAFELNHGFSGGSKSELIRQLEPLVRAASGDEPFELPVVPDGNVGWQDPDTVPFEPVLAKKQQDAVRRGGE